MVFQRKYLLPLLHYETYFINDPYDVAIYTLCKHKLYMDKSFKASAERIFDRILKDIKPSPAEVQDTTYRANSLMDIMGKIVPKDVELRIVGSISRGTNLKGDADIDIFMLFSKAYKKDRLVKLGLEYGKKAARLAKGTCEIKYAEHPYIRLYLKSAGLKADIVPASKIAEIGEMATTVDRTPFHTEFINSNLSDRQRDEVRVLKYFLKVHHIYGAEVKTGGFSGYLCELLIHQYGSLAKLLESASSFKQPLILDPLFKKEITDGERQKKFASNFVVVDPVDANRNVAAGVSTESLTRFMIISRQFVSKPSISLFYREKFASPQAHQLLSKFIKESGLETFIITATVPEKSEDVIFPQLRKVAGNIGDHLRKKGFDIYFNLPFVRGKSGIILLMAPRQRLTSRVLKGPSVFVADASRHFAMGHQKALGFFVSESAIHALEKAKHPTIVSALEDLPANMRFHKDINLRKSKVIHNRIPKEMEFDAYCELLKKITI